MKIAYIVDGLYNSGGTERVLTIIANSLCKELDLTIITLKQNGRPFFFPLSKSVRWHDLNICDVYNIRELKRSLNDFFISHQFDIVVSLGGAEMYCCHSIKDESKKIIWLHYAIDIAQTTWVGPHPSVIKKIKAQLITWRRIYHARKYNQIVLISMADLKKWQKYTDKAICIYNPLTINTSLTSNLLNKCVIAAGRLDYQKGFDYLIDAWSLVAKKHPDWHLNIFGEGDLREILQNQIDSMGLQNSITLCGRTAEIEKEYARHSVFVLSSRAEGFGLVLVEAASCGLPLVSFDCPSGPSELVLNGKNGFLVNKVGDVSAMARAICYLIEDEGLRKKMGIEAQEFSKLFQVENIVPQWEALFASFES